MVTFLFPSKTFSGCTTALVTTTLGSSTTFFVADPAARRHTNTTTQPIRTAREVVKTIIRSLFSINIATTASCADTTADSTIRISRLLGSRPSNPKERTYLRWVP
ncbi:Uncharacterized protein Fot_55423 [Forsythia ovata]|uniref:Secreted protein n=1 Tax=Forsythia ovata TaxID=205694 RepID=A0ABD1P4R8_9LAMI